MIPHDPAEARAVAGTWLAAFEAALRSGDAPGAAALIAPDAYWRDLVMFTWGIGWVHGAREIAETILNDPDTTPVRSLSIAEGFTPPRAGRRYGYYDVLEFYCRIVADRGEGIALVRLVPSDESPAGWAAFALMTALQDLRGHERPKRRESRRSAEELAKVSWKELRDRACAYDDRDPEVLVIGGGHSGLFPAMHLTQMGADVLVVDKHPRPGDNWRNRYKTLTLHNPTDAFHFPGMPFPDSFPEYLPKDKVANWIEAYIDAMEINYWPATEFLHGEYDDDADCWVATVSRDGVERILRPKHILVATGGEGSAPNIPELPGISTFRGRTLHSKYFTSGDEFAGQRVLVVGAATSAHDVALELHNSGGHATMLQRSPTVVVSLASANAGFAQYFTGISLLEGDLFSAANFIYPLMREALKVAVKSFKEQDRGMIEGLERVGFKYDYGEDDTGFVLKFFSQRGGYYFNVGGAEAIAEGRIGLIQNENVDRFVAEGLRLKDGTVERFDAVVYATGYLGPESEVARLFGQEVAERVGRVGGFDERGEIRASYRRTGQRGLWFQHGSIPTSRVYALPLALQIKAALVGALPGYGGSSAVAAAHPSSPQEVPTP